MLKTNEFVSSKRAVGHGNLLDIATLIDLLRRRKILIGGFTIAFSSLALLFSLTTIPLYTSEAELLIDSRNAYQLESGSSSQNGSNLLSVGMDPANIDSQVEILKSERIAGLVLRKLKLDHDLEFMTPGNLITTILSKARPLLSFFSETINEDPKRIPRVVMEEFQDRLDVKRTNTTYVLTVSFRARTRERAALIANTIADTYFTDQLQAKYEATRRASSWLQDRIKDLREASIESDRAVQSFKANNNIISFGSGQLINEQQLGEVSSQLVGAKAATAEADAKYRSLKIIVEHGDPDGATADVLSNPVFNDLRGRYTKAAKRLAEVAVRLGDTHPAVVNLRSEMSDLRELTLQELKRAMDGFRSTAEIAHAREQSLVRSLSELSGQAATSNQDQVQLRELERDAETNKTLYAAFLERYKTSLQKESFPITDGRLLSEASPPRLKSHPKTALLLVVGAVAGFAAGCIIVLLKELTDGVFRTPEQLETALGVPCIGVLPTMAVTQSRARPRPGIESPDEGKALPRDLGPLHYAINEPLTRFAETLRAIKVAADNTTRFDDVKVLSMVSAIPGEGKSTVAANFAQLQAHSGRKVLLIDADLRNPMVSEAMAPGIQAGLVEVLQGKAVIGDVLRIDAITGLHVLPSIRYSNPHTSSLLGSEAMRNLVHHASTVFDLVVIDLPPLIPIVDVHAISPIIDAFIFVAQFGKTPIVTAEQALRSAPLISDRLLGSVLNQANLKLLRRRLRLGDQTYDSMPAYRAYVAD